MHDAIMQAQDSQKSVALLHLLNRITIVLTFETFLCRAASVIPPPSGLNSE